MFKGLKIKILIEQINSSDWKKREEAAKLLGELGELAAFDPLVKALGDYVRDVKKAAVIALGKLKDPRSEQHLLKAIGDVYEDVRFAAAKALGELKGPMAVEFLVAVLEDGNENARSTAARVLGEYKDSRVTESLIKALGDEATAVRIAAAATLSQLGESHWQEIIKGDTEDFFRLRWMGPKDSRAVDPLIKALGNRNVNVRSIAAEALGDLKSPRAVDHLIQTLEDKNEYVRAKAAKALGILGDSRAVEPLAKILQDSTGVVRKAVSAALVEINKPFAEKLLNERKSRSRMVEASQNNRPVERLIRALEDGDWGVRKEAAKALGELNNPQSTEAFKDPRTVESLIKALEDEHKELRIFAARALGGLSEPRTVDALIKALGDEDWGVRKVAAKELGKLKDPRAVEPLIQALEGGVSEAAKALSNFEDVRAEEALKGHRIWSTGSVPGGYPKESLIQMLKHDISSDNHYMSKAAEKALEKLIEKKESFIKFLGTDADVRKEVAYVLNELGESKWKEIFRGDSQDFSRLVESEDTHAEEILINALDGNYWKTRKEASLALIIFAKRNPQRNMLNRDIVSRMVSRHEDYLLPSSDCVGPTHIDRGIGIPESEF